MSDTQVFDRNHAMQTILKKAKKDNYLRFPQQLIDLQREIRIAKLSEDQLKFLIKLCNELIFIMNREIRTDDTSS